jgi:hypothetical protein
VRIWRRTSSQRLQPGGVCSPPGSEATAQSNRRGPFTPSAQDRRFQACSGAAAAAWSARALPSLQTFVRGLRKDLTAVVAGLTMPYSNGPIEGANTKVKLLKRQMYGRAGFTYSGSGPCSADRWHHLFCARADFLTGPRRTASATGPGRSEGM